MRSVEIIAEERSTLTKRIMARQQEAATLRRQIDNDKAAESRLVAEGHDREAETARKRHQEATSKLEGLTGGISELQQRIKAVEQELANVDAKIGDAEQRFETLLAEFQACVIEAIEGLGSFIRVHDPVGLLQLMRETSKVERGIFMRRTGYALGVNAAASEQRMAEYHPLHQVLTLLAELQLSSDLQSPKPMRARRALMGQVETVG